MKTICVKILLCIACIAWSANVNAYDFECDGICYNILTEGEYGENGTCEVTYDVGYEADGYTYAEPTYTGSIVIPEEVNFARNYWEEGKLYTVVAIGSHAFSGCQLDYITLPSTITRIGDNAFSSCKGISSLSIPLYIAYIGDNAFYSSDLAGSLIIPNTCKYIGESAFGYTKITELTKQSIGYWSYDDDYEKIFCTIKRMAFCFCENLRYVNLNAVDCLLDCTPFNGCDKLSSIEGSGVHTNPEGTKGTLVVDGCLYNFTVEDNKNKLELLCCPGGKESYATPNNSTAFNRTNVLTSIGLGAFMGCNKIENLDIPSTVTKIGDYALSLHTNAMDYTYHKINIPESVEKLGYSPFGMYSYNLDIYLYNTKIKDISSMTGNKHGTVHIPYGTKSSFNVEHVEPYFDVIDDIFMAENQTVTMAGNIRTSCSDYDLDYTNVPNLKAYIASGFDPSTGLVLLTRVYKVPAGEGLVLKGDAGDYEVPVTSTNMYYTNLLKGVTRATTISPTEDSYTNFILANGSHGIGFYTLSEAGEIAAGKAYLQLPTSAISSSGRGIKMRFDDEEGNPTAVSEVESQQPNESEYYDMQGRKVRSGAARKGMYIIRNANGSNQGKKLFIR